MGNELKELDVVALLEPLPYLSLKRGMVGAVVALHDDPRLCSVEFVIDKEGATRLVNDIETRLLLPLQWWRR